MDKKQKKKTIFAVCFVLACGAVYVGIHFGTEKRNAIVLVRQGEEAGNGTVAEEEKKETNSGTEMDGVTVEGDALRASETIQEVYVHLCGAVVTEGVYLLPKGSRLIDAVTAAGGFTEEADTSYHNLAAELSDGQKVYVPTLLETETLSVTERVEAVGSRSEENMNEAEAKVNINTASKEELMTLSGIGEAKAESILLYREKVGPFQSIEELKHVSGIGEAMFEQMKDEIVAE